MPSNARQTLIVAGRQWLSPRTFELRFKRPQGFQFAAGQKLCFLGENFTRDYTLVSGPGDVDLAICVRYLPQGRFSPRLAAAKPNERFEIQGPSGYFTCQPSARPKVFVATGTGIAPFVSFVRDGARDFICLHGVRETSELYYRDVVAQAAKYYVPCLSSETPQDDSGPAFSGRVTRYLADQLAPGIYDFYLCGRSEMIAEAVHTIDANFPESLVYTETFY